MTRTRKAKTAAPKTASRWGPQREHLTWYGEGQGDDRRRHRILVSESDAGDKAFSYEFGVPSADHLRSYEYDYQKAIDLPNAVVERLSLLHSHRMLVEHLVSHGDSHELFSALIAQAVEKGKYQRAADLQRLREEACKR
jgi:hypothetical protein